MSVRQWAIQGVVSGFMAMGAEESGAAPSPVDEPRDCELCADWNRPQEPFRIFGNTYYVGVAGLSSILVTGTRGLIVLDGALPQSVPLIKANIEKLGFRVEDVRLILNSHAHFDHAGGLAALQRLSGAPVAASPASARALTAGGPSDDDPQFTTPDFDFPRVEKVRTISDGETQRLGDVAITPRFTPGHTPGGTTWTWRSCEGDRCVDIVYADSLNAVSAPGFKFTGNSAVSSRVDAFERSIQTVEGLPCDVLLSPHPRFFDMAGKLRRRQEEPGVNPFIDAAGCKAYASDARDLLRRRVEEERL